MVIRLNEADFSSVAIGKVTTKKVYSFTELVAEQSGDNKYYDLSNAVGSSVNGASIDGFCRAQILVNSGDKIFVKCYGGGGARAYGFGINPTSASPRGFIAEPIAPANYDATNGIEIIAPKADVVYLYVNNKSANFAPENVVIEVTSES